MKLSVIALDYDGTVARRRFGPIGTGRDCRRPHARCRLVEQQGITVGRRRLLLGYLEDGREFSLAVRGRNVLVTGDATSGNPGSRVFCANN